MLQVLTECCKIIHFILNLYKLYYAIMLIICYKGPDWLVTSLYIQDQVPCCQPSSQEMLNLIYMDETGTIVISPVELTRSCG